MPEIDLSSLPVSKDYSKPIEPEEGIGLKDYGKSALAGAYGVAGGVASGVDYLADTDDGSDIKGVRHWAEQGAKDTISSMSPEARDALNAGFLPGGDKSIWSPGVSISQSIGLKLANASPSLVASIIPGGIVAKVAQGAGLAAGAAGLAGTAAGGTVNATMMGGQVYDDIENSILDAKDDYLQKNSPLYQYLRNDHDGKPGVSETVAKKVLVETAADNKPLIAAAVGFATDQFGATAMAAKHAVGEAGEGVFKGLRKGAAEEAGNEAIQNASQEGLTQEGQIEAGTQIGFDWKKFAEQVVQGGTIGGLMGGAVGGVTHIGGRQGQSAAGSDRVPEDVVGPAVPTIDPVVSEAAGVSSTPRDRVGPGLDRTDDDALGRVERAIDPAIAAAAKAPDEVIPRNQSGPVFTPQDEFEADPNHELAAPAAQAMPETGGLAPQEPAQPSPQVANGQELPVQALEPPAAVARPEAAQAPTEAPSPQTGGQTIDLSTLATTDEAETQPAPPPPARGQYTLTRQGDAAPKPPGALDRRAYDIVRDGKAIGTIVMKVDGDTAEIRDMYAARPGSNDARGMLGSAGVASILRQFLTDNPQIKTLTGERVSGARRGGRHGFLGTGERVSVPVGRRGAGTSESGSRPAGQTIDLTTFQDLQTDVPRAEDRFRNRPAKPSPAQAEAGNYRMGHTRAHGFDVSVETAKGATRSGISPDGREWSVKMPADYGYLRGTKGVDGDHVDVYLGPNVAKEGPVYVVNQNNLDGSFDEHKAMLGFRSRQEAERTYKAGFSDGKGKQRIGSIVEMSPEAFRQWAEDTPKGPAVAPRADKPAVPSKRPISRSPHQRVEDAYTKLAGGQNAKPIRLSKLREELSDLDRRTVDAELSRIAAGDDRFRLSQYSDPRSLDAAERAAAFSPAGEPFHILWRNASSVRPMALRAKGRETTTPADEVRHRELAALVSDEPETSAANVVSSSRTGATTPILSRSTLGQALDRIDHTARGGLAAQINPFIAKKVAQLASDVPVHIVSDEGMVALTRDLIGRGGFPDEVSGYYDPASHSIVLRLSDANKGTSQAELSHLLVHEGLHAAFMQTIERNPAAKQLIRHLMDEVRENLGSEANDFYGMLNPHEFVSEAFSNRRFQDLLSTIPVSDSYKQLPAKDAWGLFVAAVRKFLGLLPVQTSALDAALRIGAVLTDLRTAQGQPSTPRAPYAAPAPISSEALRSGLGDAWETGTNVAGSFLSRNAARFKTLDQLRQGSVLRRLFPNGSGGDHFDDAVRAIEARHTFARQKERTGQGHAQAFVELQRRSPDVAREFAVLGQDARMADVTLLPGKPTQAEMQAVNAHLYGPDSDKAGAWQSKAKHAELQRRFSKLPDDVQRQFLDAVAYFRDTQVEQVTDFARNMIEQLAPAMPETQRDTLVRRTLAGTLRETDRQAIANDALFKALSDAREFKLQSGTYVPLSRFGDWTVRVRDKVRDTVGGREVSPGVIAFTGTEKEARKAAKTFAEKTDLTVTRVAKRYFDGDEPIKAADANSSSRVEYHVSVQTEGLYNFDSEVEAAAAERRMRETKAHSEVKGYERIKDFETRGDLSHSQLTALLRAVDARDDLLPGQKDMLRTMMGQAAIRLMSGNRILQHSLPTKMWQGASTDFARTMLSYSRAQSSALAKGKYMPAVRDSMAAMEQQVQEFDGDKSQIRHILMQELQARVDGNDTTTKGPPPALRYLLSATMLGKLASPAYSVINATDPLLKTLPVLAARHGAARAAMEMTSAYRDMGFHRSFGEGALNTFHAARRFMETSIDTSDPVASIKRRLAQAKGGHELNRMIDEMAARHALGDDVSFELAGPVMQGDGLVGQSLAKADRVFRQMPTAIEAVNRIGTAVAAYRLARAKGADVQTATDYANDTVKATQFDYSSHNTPPIFNNAYLKPLTQFKKYAQGINHLYMSAMYRAFKSDTKAERQVAMREFGNLAATHALFAGVFGIPGFEFIKAGAMLSAAFGLGGGANDLERKVKRALEASVGKTWADVVTDGAVGTAIGVDLKGRLGAGETLLFGEPQKYKKTEMLAYSMQMLAGAPGGTLTDLGVGINAVYDGDYLHAAAKMVPVKVLADTAKGIRDYSKEKMGPGEAGVKAFGFTPKRIADQGEARADRAADTAKSFERRDELRRKFLDAGTASGRARIKVQILEYNRSTEKNRRLSIPGLEKRWQEDRAAGLR
ncbi:PLxRFG domain-containing protein [Methylobacterium sp. J-088]|uniref:PLxRFG domain-containing protein n=1 Tax=Methylobacterium sp. J-088 TaxID=2836664 RepID=UPI001FBB47A9|nr:PLxRFG domain-containing protein [Methylobacterium sp. J-088]MCJ2067058.1 PLxRFG domain-containing protein [Methylobacterium sp. J-088]